MDCCGHVYWATAERDDPSRPSWVPDLCYEERAVYELVSPIEISCTVPKKMNNQLVTKELF